ncbi:MAG: DMT family transporter [Rhizobiales bacterium]|nr:DMT family transporter [Hyphomicrobiales bacterium]
MAASGNSQAAPENKSRQNAILYLLVVIMWGGSWIAIKYQVGTVPPEYSVSYRFAIAAVLMFGWIFATGRRVRFEAVDYLRFAATALFMFSTNFLLFYYASAYIVSGMLALAFSMLSIFNLINGFIFRGERAGGQILLGAALGVTGLAMIFLPGIGQTGFGSDPVRGFALALAGAYCFSVGNVMSAGFPDRNIPVFSSNAYSMMFGSIIMFLFGMALGKIPVFDFSLSYVMPLLGLSVFASAIVFGAYVTLLRNIGAARVGYATIVFPVIALGISTIFEGFTWTMWGLAGLVIILIGNFIVMRR